MENDISNQKDREVNLWCRIRKFPYELYDRLDTANKMTFYKWFCQPTSTTTQKQREDLLNNLLAASNHINARDYDQQSIIMLCKQGKSLSPLSEKEKNDYFSRF